MRVTRADGSAESERSDQSESVVVSNNGTMHEVEIPEWFMKSQNIPSRFLFGQITRISDSGRAAMFTGRVLVKPHDTCRRCGLPITDPVSRNLGYGPECVQYALGPGKQGMIVSDKWIAVSAMKIDGYTPRFDMNRFRTQFPTPDRVDAPIEIVIGTDSWQGQTFDVIHVKGSPKIKPVCLEILKRHRGSAWINAKKSWQYPLNQTTAADVVASFPEAAFVDPQILELVQRVPTPKIVEPDRSGEPIPITLADPPPWSHQTQAYWFAQPKPATMLALDMGCVSGDALVSISRAGKTRKYTLAELHFKFNDTSGFGNVWNLDVPTYIRGLKQDGKIGLVRLVATYDRGEQTTLRIDTNKGKRIRVTTGHEMVTPFGKVRADSLKVGDTLMVNERWQDREESIVAIEDGGVRNVYDVTVDDPLHTFIADDIVVGNTGKTRVAVDLVVNSGAMTTLVVCPKSVVPYWKEQFSKWGQNKFYVECLDQGAGSNKKDEAEMSIMFARSRKLPCVLVITYQSAFRDPFASWSLKQKWDCVILDESARIKSASGVTSTYCGRLGKSAKRRIALSGFPMPHSPLDIWAQYRFLDPSIFGGSYSAFRNEYAVVVKRNMYEEVVGYKNQGKLQQLMYSIAFRVTKEQALDLPETQDIERTCTLEPKASRVYKDMLDLFYAGLEDGSISASNVLVKLLRLQQITGGSATGDDGVVKQISTAKESLLEDVLEDMDKLEPVVVFCRFRYDIEVVRRVAEKQGRRVAELSGSRNNMSDWQAGKYDVIAVQIRSGGEGVNLSRAAYSIYYSLGFSLGDYEQSRARTHRPGQERKTVYIHLITQDTVDQKVYAALSSRRDVVNSIMEGVWSSADHHNPNT